MLAFWKAAALEVEVRKVGMRVLNFRIFIGLFCFARVP